MKQESAREAQRGKVQISDLSFSEIPHQTRLFLEYLSDPVSLRSFYPHAVTSPSEIGSCAPRALENFHTDRKALCCALTEINVRAGAGKLTLDNIDLLRDGKTVAVLTGQQAGLFSGPLYTVYKALSAIKMAETLNRSGVTAVPVFWAATEDHDFDEVSRTFLTGRAGELVEVEYTAGETEANRPVGDVALTESIVQIIDELFEQLPDTEFSNGLRETLSEAYAPGTRFGDAFIKLLTAIFANYGLIFVDPMHPGIKDLSSPIYADAISRSDQIVAAIRERSQLLENEGYHSQVLVEDDYFPFFWINDDGKRTALRKVGHSRYSAKGEKREFTSDELVRIATDTPHRLSPGVMLRPVVQDYLFPTVCYFGGGAEIAYFAQNAEAYRVLSRPVTPVLHRQSFTIVEAKHRRGFDKFDISLVNLFDGLEKLSLLLAQKDISVGTESLFSEVESSIRSELDRLDQHISKIDSTIANNLVKRRSKMLYHIAALRKKTLLAQLRKDDVSYRQLRDLFADLLPYGGLQERTLNILTYINKFGPTFIDWIYSAIDLEDKDHRIIEL